MSGNFLNCLKSVKDPFRAQEGRRDFPRDTTVEKGLSSCGGENLLVFLELQWGSTRVMTGTSGTRSWGLREVSLHTSREGPLGIALHSLSGPRSSSGVEAGTSGFFSRADMDLEVPLGHPQGSQDLVMWSHASQLFSPAGKAVSGFLSG